jgi:methionyl-tRNA formyltransferase
MNKINNIAFFGTPILAVFVLEELEEAGIVPSVIVTAPDKPAGRKLVLTPPAVKVWADEHDIPVLQPASLKHRDAVPELANTDWDLFIVAAYNIILPQWVLDLPKKQVLNVHPSLLPKLRGPSPVRSAILRDERDSVGVSIIVLDAQVDHGPIVAQATVELPEWPVQGYVLDELLFREGGRLLAEVIPLWFEGNITPDEQKDAEATFTSKFEKANGEIDLAGDAYKNYLTYCAMEGWPGIYTFIEDSTNGQSDGKIRLKITEAEYTDGEFRPVKVVPEGKKEILWEEWKRAHSL